jgi:hypothetical protein
VVLHLLNLFALKKRKTNYDIYTGAIGIKQDLQFVAGFAFRCHPLYIYMQAYQG